MYMRIQYWKEYNTGSPDHGMTKKLDSEVPKSGYDKRGGWAVYSKV
jgi:hypothetical protein